MVAIVVPAPSHLRLPPQSIESEQSVLGGLLLDNCAWDRVGDVLAESDFYRSEHRLIFRAIARLIETGKPADSLTIAEFLNEHGKLDETGGLSYIGSLALNTPNAANVRRYAEIVRDRAILRSMAGHAQQMLDDCTVPNGADPAEITGRMEQAISNLTNRQQGDVVRLGDAVLGAVKHADAMHAQGGGMAGLVTGFVDLDRITSGFADGDLIILAARPGMGKSALVMNIAEHVAQHGETVAVFSLEMSKQQLAMRVLAGKSRVSMHHLRTGRVNDDQWSSITEASTRLLDLPILLDDTPAMTCAQIRARCRQIKRQHGLALIVVDYLQLMRGDGDNRTQEVGSISRGLKSLAKELAVPVIALSQLSRQVEGRNDKRPLMSDLRDSGEIEQDADFIALLYRDEIYNKDTPAKGTAELLVRKHRNGPLGDIRLCFREELMRFENYGGPEIKRSQPQLKCAVTGFDYKSAKAGE
ncbi:MAG: replicative DNA helicase [Bryobacteraceae bacterium]|nr:replicative DNA helicase [Bryobacteraceae bacterium]